MRGAHIPIAMNRSKQRMRVSDHSFNQEYGAFLSGGAMEVEGNDCAEGSVYSLGNRVKLGIKRRREVLNDAEEGII